VPGTIRVVSYNVHSCVGVDRQHLPERVAEAIEAMQADVIALQEVELGRRRTDHRNQPEELGKRLGMHVKFHPAVHHPDGKYGIAVLSRYPMLEVHALHLPRLRLPFIEPRVALGVSLRIDGSVLNLLNTHLGLLAFERARQVRSLIRMLEHHFAEGPTVLCGDLNATPGSPECRLLRKRMHDAFARFSGARTYPVNFPLRRLDHILLTQDIHCVGIAVPQTPLTRVASDHFPVLADLRLSQDRVE